MSFGFSFQELKGLHASVWILKDYCLKNWAAGNPSYLVFDEFFVSDITDAMILGPDGRMLISVTVLSCRPPRIFLQMIFIVSSVKRGGFFTGDELINQNTRVVNVD